MMLQKALLIACFALPAWAGEITSSVAAEDLPKGKTTPLGLYLTPTDAHEALTADPSIVFLDVRDPVEINYIGHAVGVDAIVPLRLTSHVFNDQSGTYQNRDNQAFVAEAEAIILREGGDKETPVFVICRSGSRSAVAARMLVEAGYLNVWNLVEGFEGDKDSNGVRTRNGWRNASLPWTYKIAPDAAWRAPDKN